MLLTTLRLERASDQPLYQQLVKLIREAIQKGGISPGDRLPSIRNLAQALGVSRITVENSYNQLLDEGYLVSRPKQGYYAADVRGVVDYRNWRKTHISQKAAEEKPEERNSGRGEAGPAVKDRAEQKPEAGRSWLPDNGALEEKFTGQNFGDSKEATIRYNFRSNAVDSESFNAPVWRRYMNHALKQQELLASYGPAQGEARLLYTLAKYSFEARDVQCRPQQIVVGAGTQSLLHILCGILRAEGSRPFDAVGLPQGFYLAEQIFRDHGYRLFPFSPADIEKPPIFPGLGLICCNPASPYQRGNLPAARRLALLRWAKNHNILVLEDDYIGEFRYLSRPFPSLQSLSGGDGVIYLGSFSRTLLPSLRISYMVLPPSLLPAYRLIRDRYNQTASGMEQLALADFIADGHLNRHIRHLRRLYAAKNQQLRQAIAACFPYGLRIADYEGALRLLLILDSPLEAAELARLALKASVAVIPLENPADQSPNSLPPQIMLSYAGIPEKDILPATKALADAWLPHLRRNIP